MVPTFESGQMRITQKCLCMMMHMSFNFIESTDLWKEFEPTQLNPQIDNEMKDGFVKHVGRQMLDKDFVEEP